MCIYSLDKEYFSNQSFGLHKLYMYVYVYLYVNLFNVSFCVCFVLNYIRYQLEFGLNSMRFNFHQFHKFSFFNSGAWQEISCSVFLVVMIVVAR